MRILLRLSQNPFSLKKIHKKDKKFKETGYWKYTLQSSKSMWTLSQITLYVHDFFLVFLFVPVLSGLHILNKVSKKYTVLTFCPGHTIKPKPFLSNCFAHFCLVFCSNKVICVLYWSTHRYIFGDIFIFSFLLMINLRCFSLEIFFLEFKMSKSRVRGFPWTLQYEKIFVG